MSDYPTFVAARFTKHATGGAGLVHAGIGMLGEVLELRNAISRGNQNEELGDIEFYLCAAHSVLGIPWNLEHPYANGGHEFIVLSLTLACESFLDKAKKVWVYEQPIKVDTFATPIYEIHVCLTKLYAILGFDRRAVIGNNVTKLSVRYPGGYTDDLAAARKDKA